MRYASAASRSCHRWKRCRCGQHQFYQPRKHGTARIHGPLPIKYASKSHHWLKRSDVQRRRPLLLGCAIIAKISWLGSRYNADQRNWAMIMMSAHESGDKAPMRTTEAPRPRLGSVPGGDCRRAPTLRQIWRGPRFTLVLLRPRAILPTAL